MRLSTEAAYRAAAEECRDLFMRKTADYGNSWRLFRLTSLTDQILIKARRIRQLEEMPDRPAVPEGAADEYRGIFNYAVMALIRLWHADRLPEIDLLGEIPAPDLPDDQLRGIYDLVVAGLEDLLARKNHDYGEAWRLMRVSSYTDQILVRVWRLKKMEDNAGRTAVSEGADANYADIANYSAFALIKLAEPGED